jgi:F-type H+-transporting ATPase subunit b
MDAIIRLFSNFGVTWDRLLGQIVTFVVLLVVLRLVLYKPMLAMLAERKQKIAQGLKDAEEAAKARRQAEEEATVQLKEATKAAELLLDEAKHAADRLKNEIKAQTQLELQQARKDQEASLAQAKEQMISEVRQDIVALVIATTTKVLASEITKEQQQSIVKQAVKELE